VSTARTSPRHRSSGSSPAIPTLPVSRSTGCRTRSRAIR
jgi:hypothetical protein